MNFKITFMSITQRYKGIDGIAVDARQCEALFNNLIIGILLTNQNGEIININSFAENQFGYKRKELIGKPIELLIPPKLDEKYKNNRQSLYHPQSGLIGKRQDLHAIRKDGSAFLAEISFC